MPGEMQSKSISHQSSYIRVKIRIEPNVEKLTSKCKEVVSLIQAATEMWKFYSGPGIWLLWVLKLS